MIQDIYPHHLENPYDKEVRPEKEDTVFCYDGVKIFVRTEETFHFPKVSDFAEETHFTFLFRMDGHAYFLLNPDEDGKEQAARDVERLEQDGYEFVEARAMRYMEESRKHTMFAVMTGKHIADWYRDTKYCGRCGAKMEHSETERAMTCPDCHYTSYPRIMPAVIVGVTNGDKILLTKYRKGFRFYALIAGFTEIGETLEETVKREVMEEAGIRVKNIRYYKSQPWGVANDILIGFYCDVDGDDTIHMDPDELKFAEWVKREDIELQPDDYSLTNEMMMRFKQGKEIR